MRCILLLHLWAAVDVIVLLRHEIVLVLLHLLSHDGTWRVTFLLWRLNNERCDSLVSDLLFDDLFVDGRLRELERLLRFVWHDARRSHLTRWLTSSPMLRYQQHLILVLLNSNLFTVWDGLRCGGWHASIWTLGPLLLLLILEILSRLLLHHN